MSTLQGWPQSFPNATSDVYTSAAAGSGNAEPIAVGTRARDSAGNEYIWCNFEGNVYPEIAVQIASDYSATVLTSANGAGPVGIVVGTNGQSGLPLVSAPVSPYTSDQHGWVQVYGRSYVQVGTNASSPSDAANGPTTVRTSAAIAFVANTSATTPPGVLGMVSARTSISTWKIHGMIVATDASPAGEVSICTAVSATHIGSHVAVFLNYPYVEYEDFEVS